MNSATLQPWLEHFGIAVSAITGVLAARGKRIDLFGVLVLALVTAFGGGTVRDVLVSEPVAWMRTPAFLLNATATALAAFFIARVRDLPRGVLLVADASALALFTLIGTRKGVALGFTPPVAVLLGVVTGVAGGILRDVLTGEVPLVFQPEIRLYATAAMLGAAAFTTLHAARVDESFATFAAMAVVLALRLAGIRWKISLPVLEAHPHHDASPHNDSCP
ncbi:MAG TPA: trimeric intracellular cation channel family protein [Verrucomicrobiae bacterium]